MVDQGIMPPVTADQFAPDAAPTAGQFAVSVSRMFNLPAPPTPATFADLGTSSPYYAAAQSAFPYSGRQILCPGCDFGNNFNAELPVLPAAATISLIYILHAQHRVALLSPATARQALAGVADAGKFSPLAQIYLATALHAGIITLNADHRIGAGGSSTRADLALRLFTIQQNFKLPQLAHPAPLSPQ
jgi:hypothetical protein